MRFTKAKIVAAGMILAGICMIAPQQLRAEVPKTQMDGVMGQSIKEEMDDTQISDVDTQRDGLLSTYAIPRLLGASKASSGYTQDFLDGSFTSKVDYTSVTSSAALPQLSFTGSNAFPTVAFNPPVFALVSLYQKFTSRFPVYPLTFATDEYCQNS